VEISSASPPPRNVPQPDHRWSQRRRVTGLIIALATVGILAGLIFAPLASAATGDFIISGRGYGQGQGMSQWGAWQGARLGKTYQEILGFYYPGTVLQQVSAVAPSRTTITVRITTSVDTFTQVQLTAAATSAMLLDSTGATIKTLAVGDSVTLVYNGGKVQISDDTATYDYLDLKPDSDSGRVTVYPTPLWSGGDRSYWGFIRVKPDSDSGKLLIHNVLPIDKFVSGVAEISPDWAKPSSTSYYALEAVKAQAVAARSYIVSHSGSVPYDDTRDMNYVGYDYEATLPGVTQAAQETAGEVLTYGGKPIATHFSSCSGGYTTNSYWSDTGQLPYEPAQPDPWSLTAPPTLPAYAWSVTISPATLASKLGTNVGTITQVDVTERDASDSTSHARYLKITGSTGTTTISARNFRSLLSLKSTLILSVVKDGSLNRYQQNDGNLAYIGTWTPTSATGASSGSHRYANSAGSCTVSFYGTYLAWQGKKGPTYGKARLTLDGVDKGMVDLYNGTITFGKVWETDTLEKTTHTLKIAWTGERNPLATNTNISVDAFDINGNIVQAPKVSRVEQSDSRLYYTGKWTVGSATAASGGSHRYTNVAGSCTVSLNGTYLAWYGKRSPSYGNARVYVDGVDTGTVDLYSSTEVYGKVWDVTLSSGVHNVTIAWTGTTNHSGGGTNVSVDAFEILGAFVQAPAGTRYQQDATRGDGTPYLAYTGSWARFSTSGASGGSYARANTKGASVIITFKGTYLGWIATKGTTLGKALVSLDGGAAKQIDLAATAVAYQRNVWSTGMLPSAVHTVKISWDTSNTVGKFISVDAVDVVGALQ
jgi:SpoIID/LytB domain protein